MNTNYLFILSFLAFSSAEAFLIQTFHNQNDIPTQQKWHGPESIEITIDQAGSKDIGSTQTHRIIRESFRVWENVQTSNLSFKFTQNSKKIRPSQNDRINLIFFDERNEYLKVPEGSGIIAVTRINSITKTGEIIDADIIFNGNDFEFSAENLSVNSINLIDVAVHEVGHLIGLEHTPIDGHPRVRPTMNPYNRGDEQGQAKTLEPDDIAGISYLYPSDDYSRQIGNVSGEIFDSDGNPIFGVHVVAKNINNGSMISTVSGANAKNMNIGEYQINGLPPEVYKIFIEPINGDISQKNFGGIFSNFPTDFSSEFYDNIKFENLALQLTVEAGENLSGINFFTGSTRPGYPYVESTNQIANTPDQKGPYIVTAITENTENLWLEYWDNLGLSRQRVSMFRDKSGFFKGQIPGFSAGIQVNYRFEAEGQNSLTSFFPSGNYPFSFQIIRAKELEQPIIFTASRNDNMVTVFGMNSGKELARIAVGQQPIQMLLDSNRNMLFVGNTGSNFISIINTNTFQEVERIPTDNQPLDLAFSPDRSKLYVSNSGSATITIINIDNRKTNSIAIPNMERGPFGIAANNKSVFVTDIDANSVIVLNTDGSFRNKISVPTQPRSLLLDYKRNLLWVSSLKSDTLTAIGTQTEKITTQIKLPTLGTFALEQDIESGIVFVSAHQENALIAIDSQNQEILAHINTGINPRGIFVLPKTRKLWITNAHSNKILSINTDTFAIIDSFSTGIEPRGIAVVNTLKYPTVVSRSADMEIVRPSLHIFPNPFNSTTKILINIPEYRNYSKTKLSIFNILGQHINTLVDAKLENRSHEITWDGKDKDGNYMGSGYYFLKLVQNNLTIRKTITLIR